MVKTYRSTTSITFAVEANSPDEARQLIKQLYKVTNNQLLQVFQ